MAVRLGGDEFVLLLEGAEAEARAMRIARQLLSDLQHPFLLPEQQVTLSCSIGMAFAPRHGAGDMLLGCADAAMYAAKRSGGSCALCYDTHMASADSADQLQLQQGLREALQRGQLALHFQPKLSAADGSLHGVEALLRWRHPGRGMISPAVFIPVAERFGLIGRIGDWVIEQACEQLARWQAQGLVCRVAINLSAHQLRQPDLARRILATLERHGLDPSLLVCELTETAMMESIKDGCSVLDELDAAGVRVSIDDFGTGYSSLSYLRRLPASQLKIDRSMVTGIDVDRQAQRQVLVEADAMCCRAICSPGRWMPTPCRTGCGSARRGARCCRCRHRPTARRACGRRRRPERSGSMGASIDAAMLRPPCTTAEPCSRRPS
ncbi:hypothetical protein MASR2M32_18850 [Sphaerotilus sulfidivorans]